MPFCFMVHEQYSRLGAQLIFSSLLFLNQGWVKADHQVVDSAKIADTDEDNADWFVFDDDEVSPCKTEDVLKLKGGGDWHMSYLNFYRAKK